MELHDGSASLRKGKHLNRNERIQLEGLWKAGYPPSQIARLLDAMCARLSGSWNGVESNI